MHKEIIYNIGQAIRAYVSVEEMGEVIIKYSTLGYIETLNPENIYIEKILKSTDINKESQNTFNKLTKEYKELEGVFTNLNADSKLSNEVIYKVLSIIKESNLNKDHWQLVIDEVIDSIEISTTPNYLNELGIGIINPTEGSFYDGTCGIGQTLTKANDYSDKNLELYGQEINAKDWAICKIRLFVRGINNNNIKLGNTLTNPLLTDGNKLKTFDNAMMNFPFGLSWKNEKEDIEKDIYNRFIFGKPPISNSEWLFISHMAKSLNEDGKAVAITSSGTLFRGAGEEAIRKNILSIDCIEAVITLAPVLTTTSIPVNMVVINMNKSEELKNKILFINAENMYEKHRNQKILTKEHIDKIIDIYNNKQEIEEVSAIVNIKELEGSNLLPSKNVLKTETINEEFGAIKFKKDKLKDLNNCKTLGEIGEFSRGINVIGSNVQEAKDGEYKIINFSDVKDGVINIESLSSYNIKNNARVEAYTVQEGDILISSRGANTKVTIVPPHNEKILISQNFINFRLNDGSDPEYIKTFLESPLGQFLIEGKQAGTNVITINAKDLMKIPVLLVPKDVQVELIQNYKKEYNKVQEEIEILKAKLKENKLDLYEKMGITSTFEIL